MTDTTAIHPAILLACEQASTHKQLADDAKADAERRAHRATMNSLNKAAMEMLKGNMPRSIGDGRYLVNSRTNAGQVYQVDVYQQACTCANQHACWHLAAANVCEEVETAALPIKLREFDREYAAMHGTTDTRSEDIPF